MKITTVRYRRLQSHDRGYGHDAVEAEAQVEEHETADEAMGALQAWVGRCLGMTRQADDLAGRVVDLAREIRDKQHQRDLLAAEIKAANEVVEQYGRLGELAHEHKLAIPTSELALLGDTIPF